MKTVLLSVLMLAAAPHASIAPPTIDEWEVPWPDTRPRDPAVDATGKVWFVGQAGNYIARFDPRSGEFKRYTIEEGTFPHNLLVGPDGGIWYAGNANARIGRLDPETGKARIFPMPGDDARDPHTLLFDAKGSLWFTLQTSNLVGRLTPATGKVDIIRVPTAGARPYGISLDSRGRPWVNLFGTNKLALIDPATLALTEIVLPRADARTRRIAITADDRVWYVDYAEGVLGSYDPATRKFSERPMPSGAESRPYAMTVDAKGRLWMVETGVQPNVLVGFDPSSNAFISSTPIPSGARVVRHMIFHAPTNTVWFGTDAGTLARAQLD